MFVPHRRQANPAVVTDYAHGFANGNLVRFTGVGGVRLTFNDAAALPDGRVVFLASAEASPDTVHDGAVSGCRVGILDASGATTFDVVDAAGALCRIKLEGIEPIGGDASSLRFVVVADDDNERAPALSAELRLPLAPPP